MLYQLSYSQILVGDICRGLADVHRAGVLHRDVKPQNIMHTNRDGHARWMLIDFIDFGIARLAGAARESVIVGTLAYMAPEQALGEAVDARADLYSLCLVIYRTLTGRPAFSDTSRSDPSRHLRLPPDPGYFVPLPLDVALVLRIGIAHERDARVASADELHAAFDAACEQRLSSEIRERARRLLEQESWPSPATATPTRGLRMDAPAGPP
jgi:serine/threonine protein kinase